MFKVFPEALHITRKEKYGLAEIKGTLIVFRRIISPWLHVVNPPLVVHR